LDFDSAIAAQDITCRDKEACAELGSNSVAPARRARRPPPQSPEPFLIEVERTAALLRVWIHLKDTERVAFRIDEISLPTGVGDCEFRESNDAADLRDSRGRRVEALDLKRANESIGSALWRRSFGRALQQAASRTSRFYGPIRDGQSLDLGEFPTENL
jgi:hypothetical protein